MQGLHESLILHISSYKRRLCKASKSNQSLVRQLFSRHLSDQECICMISDFSDFFLWKKGNKLSWRNWQKKITLLLSTNHLTALVKRSMIWGKLFDEIKLRVWQENWPKYMRHTIEEHSTNCMNLQKKVSFVEKSLLSSSYDKEKNNPHKETQNKNSTNSQSMRVSSTRYLVS